MSLTKLRIATRESPLALWQAYFVRDLLTSIKPDLEVEILGFTTKGDRLIDVNLAKVGGKGLFVKELENALLNNTADIAVHSMKDVPMDATAGLTMAAICERADSRDVLVNNTEYELSAMPAASVIGTSSLRRACQLSARFPELEMKLLRGNVNTRLKKLDNGEYDAIILAAVGLQRLEFEDRISSYFSVEESIPAPGQGALGVECRLDDLATIELLQQLHHLASAQCVLAERVVSRRLGGSCSVPIGAHAIIADDEIHLHAMLGTPDGHSIIYARALGDRQDPEAVGNRAADDLMAQGASELLASLKL